MSENLSYKDVNKLGLMEKRFRFRISITCIDLVSDIQGFYCTGSSEFRKMMV